MRSGKEHAARPTLSPVQNEGPTASGSGVRDDTANAAQQIVSGSFDIQPTRPNTSDPAGPSMGTHSESGSGVYQDVLVDCNALVEGYRKGEISKAAVYVKIQLKLTKALGDDRARSDAAFRSFIASIESHDAEVGAA